MTIVNDQAFLYLKDSLTEARERILEIAVNRSLKLRPPRLPTGNGLRLKKKRDFENQLNRELPKIPQHIINLCNADPSCIKAEMIGHYIQCRFEDCTPEETILRAIFVDPYPESLKQLPSIFKDPKDHYGEG